MKVRLECPDGNSNGLRITDLEGRDLTKAMALERVLVDLRPGEPVRAQLELAWTAFDMVAAADVFVREPITGEPMRVRAVELEDGTRWELLR